MSINNRWVLVTTAVTCPISAFDGTMMYSNGRTEFKHVSDHNLRVVIDPIDLTVDDNGIAKSGSTVVFEVNMLHRERGRLGGFKVIAIVGQTTYNQVITKALQGC